MPKKKQPTPTKAVRVNRSNGKYNDDEYVILENEFVQIRQCLGMYIGTGGTEGAMHLLNEIMTNSIDECANEGSPADTIDFYFFEKEQKFIVGDNGRGIPIDLIMTVVNQKHASTKFGRKANKYSGGQNGVGLTVTAALSDAFSIMTMRGEEHYSRTVYVEDSQLKDGGIKKEKGTEHGCITTFIPSKQYLGNFTITCEDVEDYLRRLSYVIPSNVKIKYMGTTKKNKTHAATYKHQGIGANVEYLGENLEFPPITIKVPEVEIEYPNRDSDFFKMELAFSYDKTVDEPLIASFCNYIATKEGGYHETVGTRAISDFFTKQAKALDPNHKYEITSEDCKKGLVMVVNCDHTDPMFEGQHKSKVDQKNILTYGRKPIIATLTNYFETNNGLLRKIIQYLRQIARIRLEAHKIRTTSLKKPTTFLDDADMKIFVNVSDRNYGGYKELILAEGDSAISAVGAARNVKCQAIFAITGVVANTFGMSDEQVMAIPTYQALVKVLGCGIGKDFDINKLKWNAIIIATDGDVDGSNITSLLSVFFACHLPCLVTSGKLYKVIPPLYRIDAKTVKKYYNGREYLFDKGEYYHLYHKIIADNLSMAMVKPSTQTEIVTGQGDIIKLTKKEKMKLLDSTVEYLSNLQNLVNRSACQADILEYVCYFIVISRDNINKFVKLLKAKFPELDYDKEYQTIRGSHNGNNVTLIIDSIFFAMAEKMIRIIAECPTFYILCKNKNAKTDPDPMNWDLLTYGQFLMMCNMDYTVGIAQRYKGLGEEEAAMIFLSMMNPKLRKLIRINMDDIPRAMDTLRLLHGKDSEMRLARRELLKNTEITLEDIDN